MASLKNIDFSYAATFGIQAAQQLLNSPLPKGTFLNINIPSCNPEHIKGTRITRQGQVLFQSRFLKGTSPYKQEYFWLSADAQIARDHGIQHYVKSIPSGQVDKPTIAHVAGSAWEMVHGSWPSSIKISTSESDGSASIKISTLESDGSVKSGKKWWQFWK